MGIWDKIKSVKNMVTGGGADVTLTIEESSIKGLKINVRAFIKDADMKVDKVYLKVRSVEKVVAPDIDIARNQNGQVVRTREHVHHSETIFEQEFLVTGAETLNSQEEYNWSTNIELPERALPTYKGRNAQNTWMVFAGLDASGNDPDSGWVEVDLYPN